MFNGRSGSENLGCLQTAEKYCGKGSYHVPFAEPIRGTISQSILIISGSSGSQVKVFLFQHLQPENFKWRDQALDLGVCMQKQEEVHRLKNGLRTTSLDSSVGYKKWHLLHPFV